MNEEITNQVEELGLSNKEARVYIANLMLGPAGVQQIADASGIKRVTTYVILESLVNLGLVSQISKAKKTLFNAESPEHLRRLLEKREQSLQDQRVQLEELLPELNDLKTLPKHTPSVKLYDSAEGIKTMIKNMLIESKRSGTGTIYSMSNLDQVYEFFPEFIENDANPERLKIGVAIQAVYTSSKGAVYQGKDAGLNRNSRYVPYDKYPLTGDILICGDSFALLTLTGTRPLGVAIHSPELSKTMHGLFSLAWEAAEPYNKP